ncbi:hypothetical protein SSOG_01270 [Streptomyces himastatinicus ATCC 53653]|uniref:Uncharacterized protein n=1 Tax=Streptomyces himastatinicus ATCC 53653 TaxID=457427 RepID=D9WLF5_9ACTN|nr:hypothetical protein SSOG_01270 [Streptomyces himastatinicus ATCC 53653]
MFGESWENVVERGLYVWVGEFGSVDTGAPGADAMRYQLSTATGRPYANPDAAVPRARSARQTCCGPA